jgi:CRISPR-associated endonuclease Csn1
MAAKKRYRVGVDVGTNSVGLAAIEVDDSDMPVNLLNAVVFIHDSGVDPNKQKKAETRLATAGVARRTRRLVQRRHRRLAKLDRNLEQLGWPLTDPLSITDPYLPWKTRAQLAQEKLEGDEQKRALAIALRHIARHRGWRSPYVRVESLHVPSPDSEEFNGLKERVTKFSGVVFDDGVTPAEVICETGLKPGTRLRSAPGQVYGARSTWDGESLSGKAKEGIIGGKLRQSDNANEIRKIGHVQGLPTELVNQLIDWVFEAETPKGKAGERAGKDDLPGQGKFRRASKADLAFQEFRITAFVANIRVYDDGRTKRTLTHEEREAIINFLMTVSSTDLVTWEDIAEVVGLDRNQMYGVAARDNGQERVSANPPINVTADRILKSNIKPLVEWWKDDHSPNARQALITALSNADELKETDPGAEEAREFLANLDDTVLEKLENLHLPAGRAAYSTDSLRRINRRMREDDLDVFSARKMEFGVPDDWQPEADPIGEPVGNPAVDRVLKIVNRWLMAAESEWGAPLSVNIEHIRSAFGSEAQARVYERETGTRHKKNAEAIQEAREKLGIRADLRRSDTNRVLALQRQNCQCAYCGEPISYPTSEMDHIVPRKGTGSSNQRSNLVAVCIRCNRAKSNTPFAVWASHSGIEGVSLSAAITRVKQWNDDPALNRIQNRNFRNDVIMRLKKTTEDEPIDARSIESVAWMAVELRHRVEGHYRKNGTDVDVNVFRGAITAEARRSTGFEGRVELLGGHGKTRLDRRHHAMDAATIALMRPGVAQVLAERQSLRDAQRISGERETWKDYWGSRNSTLVGEWRNQMNRLLVLFNDALARDGIPVTQNIRLRLGNGEAHGEKIRKLIRKHVGDAWTVAEIDRAESPQLWCALTRQPDFDSKSGLPENPDRSIRVKSAYLNSADEVGIFNTGSAAIAVRGGYAEIGSTIHHARIYRLPGKKPTYGMIRVFACDLVKAHKQDLFSYHLPPQSISVRTADPKVRSAVVDGTAEYLGWLVVGDELQLNNMERFHGSVAGLLHDFPHTTEWKIDGFNDPSKLRLRPTMLAAEGLPNISDVSAGTREILSKHGWRLAINQLFQNSDVTVIRRDSLGRPRLESASSLPLSHLLS